jgi:hypothetical protein
MAGHDRDGSCTAVSASATGSLAAAALSCRRHEPSRSRQKAPFMSIATLPQGPIAYRDTGGTGPVLVFVHGLVMNARLWDAVVRDLAGEYRCVTPTLALGGHRHPMTPGTPWASKPGGLARRLRGTPRPAGRRARGQ